MALNAVPQTTMRAQMQRLQMLQPLHLHHRQHHLKRLRRSLHADLAALGNCTSHVNCKDMSWKS
eukprot:1935507-Amphidinium_carterae.1